MKIAIPTNDGTSISEHFGRSAAFLIFETENGQIKSRVLKSNDAKHSHAQGECDHHSAESKSHTHQEARDHHSADDRPHSHAGILAALEGCEVVICAGMGQRAAEALKGRGTRIFIAAPASADDTVAAYLAGKLSPASEDFCRCGH